MPPTRHPLAPQLRGERRAPRARREPTRDCPTAAAALVSKVEGLLPPCDAQAKVPQHQTATRRQPRRRSKLSVGMLDNLHPAPSPPSGSRIAEEAKLHSHTAQPPGVAEDILRHLDRIDAEQSSRPGIPFPRRPIPFALHISRTVRPPELKALRISLYEGTTDPMSHLDAFELASMGKGFSDALLCLLFIETLGGRAINWLLSLEELSITSFEGLRTAFLRRFRVLIRSAISVAQLFNQQQRPDESLRAFLTRWLSTTESCRDLDKHTALQAFKHCLLPGKFLFSLVRHHKLFQYDEVIDYAAAYADDEEETWGTPELTRSLPEFTQGWPFQNEPSPNASMRTSDGSTPTRLLPFKKPSDSQSRGIWSNRWCDYHKSCSHRTAECRTAFQKLEKLNHTRKIILNLQ